MQLSLRTHYALRALGALAVPSPPTWLSIQQLADQERIPKRFLERILSELRTMKLVESRRGATGGYRLRRPPECISLAEVLRRFEGRLALVPCVSEHFYHCCSCPDESRCGLRSVMSEVRESMVRVLEGMNVAMLRDRARQLQTIPAADYVI